ncbi:MAG: ROK family protein [Actinophytocola sp.]|uniref:ROK family protein n=1 Tax=Actinophytocola sp. TaxID=1872138 RepID=UPI001321BFC1|nr:ROK family protein [Actinophytocola sp.]MPZ80958.1 ROK family protein [Actinophytocola sp.]
MSGLVLAVDIGGTKIAAGLVDRTGRLVRHATRPTAAPVFDAVHAAIDAVRPGSVLAVGLSSAGPVDGPAGTVSPINIPTWRGFPLRSRLAEVLPGVPIALAGDGLCMAAGEHWLGAGQGSDSMLGMVVSTGVGGGLVLDGRPFGGRTGNAAHVGHVVAEPAGGDPCTCGGRGCVETVASGPNLVRWARRQGWTSDRSASAAELAAAASGGDAIALAAFRRGGRAVGMAVVATATVCDLDLVVIGGGVAQAGEVLFGPVRETVAEHAGLSYLADLRVEPAKLGTRAGLFGAAALAFRTL